MARELAKDSADKALFQRARKFLTFYKDVQAKDKEGLCAVRGGGREGEGGIEGGPGGE